MNAVERRQAALAKRLGVTTGELEPLAAEAPGARFQLQPGGFYQVYSSDEEKQVFAKQVPDVPFIGQIRDTEGKAYNVYLAVERGATAHTA
ncbi:MAG TPA: hypothetical protein VF278_12745 [Pirellulales bacterium]